MKRNAHYLLLVPLMVLSMLVGCTDKKSVSVSDEPTAKAQVATKDPLLFAKDNFTVETMTVQTSAGEKKVTYRSYMHIPYVADPVDTDYQSLNVSVPIEIDGVAVDTTNAPILFANNVGGYMSFNNATGGMGLPPGFFPGMRGGMPEGQGGQQGGVQGGLGGMPAITDPSGNDFQEKQKLALTAGYVVVEPGCRGRDNQAEDGTYYGKAPAAIVDLKAAVRYIRHNKGVMPGNVDWIISTGCSAGGGLSSLLGASGNSPLYDPYLKEIGAADADDNVYACACHDPVMDLEHADMAYEWMYGATPLESGDLVDQELSKQLKALNAEYQASLNLKGKNGFGTITADNYDEYILQYYLIPSVNKYLKRLSNEERNEYMANNQWITWRNNSAVFTFAGYVSHVGRMKGLPAFDDFDMEMPEPILFGNRTTDARHFTDFSLQQTAGDPNARIDSELQTLVNMMNPMYFIGENNPGCAKYWWIRYSTGMSGMSQTNVINMAVSLENRIKDVNARMYWEAGHCEDYDPEGLIAWIGDITGFTKNAGTGK